MRQRRWGCWTGCLAAILVPLAGLFILVMIPVWRDNARLATLDKRVREYPLPPMTRNYFTDDSDVTFGRNLTGGSGDYCDYRIRLTLETALTEEEIRSYYGKAAIAGAEGKADISLWFEDSGEGGAHRVIVQVYDSHSSDWDWRCT